MPRDLHTLAKDDLSDMPTITRSPDVFGDETASTMLDATDNNARYFANLSQEPSRDTSKRDQLHPYTQTLTVSDVDSCTRLEEEAFDPQERCSREKFHYRLKTCGELSLGIFTSHSDNEIPTAATSAPVYTGAPKRKAALLGHIVATKSTNKTVTDADMALPPTEIETGTSTNAHSPTSTNDNSKLGHQETGRTICIHSLAVLPEFQSRGLGRTLMKAYLQRMEGQGVADRAALITHEPLIPYYESLGFVNQGPSPCKFGGGGWFDMIKEFDPEAELA
ncbi:Hypothetical protein R9X50_00220900 [Acrodontium crateriforme]|uniref:N-acetyltransferase domain-containing protein n=1 Tax=Acrodontium crateriforme TaxID=150365 RepID=A0AAQ3M3U0_9PEZI|nr:Hypothetical protein R9X50_00220900 [Acrodontium crateriforme]